jgi:hypothetical protein
MERQTAMSLSVRLGGTRVASVTGGPSGTHEEGRVCPKNGCGTRLSIYNKREECFAHSPLLFPTPRVNPYTAERQDPIQ